MKEGASREFDQPPSLCSLIGNQNQSGAVPGMQMTKRKKETVDDDDDDDDDGKGLEKLHKYSSMSTLLLIVRTPVVKSECPEDSASGSKSHRPAEININKVKVSCYKAASFCLRVILDVRRLLMEGGGGGRGEKCLLAQNGKQNAGKLKTSLKLKPTAAPQTSRRQNRRRLLRLPQLNQGLDTAG